MREANPTMPVRGYRLGDRVEIRVLDEILATLDAEGKLQGMPFMPEMARYCGCRFTVYRRVEKTCVEGSGMRSLQDTVLLEGLRCDGAVHDGCQRGCLYFWKEAWLKPCAQDNSPAHENSQGEPATATAGPGNLAHRLPTRKGDGYFCQSTELLGATGEFSRWGLRSYLRDLRCGQLSLPRLARILLHAAFYKVRRMLGYGPLALRGRQVRPPKGDLGLEPGEWVEVVGRKEIAATLDAEGTNRGLLFDAEMLYHCGRRYQVAYPIRRIISEQTGKMVELTNTVVLEGATCQGLCAKNCPRSNHFYWRETWLRRVS